MRTRVTLAFVRESALYSLRYACDDCVHFVSDGPGGRGECSHGYPGGERRARVLREGDEVTFCKEHELA